MLLFFVEEGRSPNYEVRKIGQAMSYEIPKGPFSLDILDKRDEIVFEDNLQMGDEIPTQNQYSRTHQGLEENSPEDGPVIQLFLYGVIIIEPCLSNMFCTSDISARRTFYDFPHCFL